MSNRMIKDSICTSDKIASLSDFEFRLWVGLILSADDAGRGDARPAIIKGHVFPLRDRVSLKEIDAAVHGLAAKGCVSLYTVDGKPYFWFPTWSSHQRIRDVRPKYPGPEESDNPPQIAADCGEFAQIAADCGLKPNQTKSKSNQIETETNTHARAFEKFWKAYPKKVGKGAAEVAFKRAKAPVSELLEAIAAQKESKQWKEDGGRYIPNPATWLNQERWKDELPRPGETICQAQEAEEKSKEDMDRMRRMLEKMKQEASTNE